MTLVCPKRHQDMSPDLFVAQFLRRFFQSHDGTKGWEFRSSGCLEVRQVIRKTSDSEFSGDVVAVSFPLTPSSALLLPPSHFCPSTVHFLIFPTCFLFLACLSNIFCYFQFSCFLLLIRTNTVTDSSVVSMDV